ncbi:predicted protein [Arabidopsis lyrata subsp. lyrata]|uniref:Predicted protein n=1 Tax=Arabidopsis lyrata subsp. lyrata TaxID=81972 RepID=D7L428_ARALL|nr:predicted protein [Arabidopsis lyrata subsp. lyrata]
MAVTYSWLSCALSEMYSKGFPSSSSDPPLHRIGNRILVEQPSGGIQGNLYLLPL